MEHKKVTYKYKIDYGYGTAVLYTPYDPVERFHTLANTCFGIRKCIMGCQIYGKEEKNCPPYNERLEFYGDVYVWDHQGARKMLAPYPDEEWDLDLIEECAPPDRRKTNGTE